MAYQLVLSLPTPATVPADGWLVGYKILGDPGVYTLAGPFMSMPITIPTADPVGTLYEGYITRDCGDLTSTDFFWQTPCNCVGAGYSPAPSGTECENVQTQPPTVTDSGFCLAISQQDVYTQFGSRIYLPGYTTTTMNLNYPVSDTYIYANLSTSGLWANPTSSTTIGPMNREGVWIDSDCDGNKDELTFGVQTTIAYLFNNAGSARTIHLGIGADNQFQIVVNGTQVADSGAVGDKQFKVWHIIPIDIVSGPNYINIVGTGDGSMNDALAMVVYDNTNAEIAAATSEGDLTIPFRSSSLIGTSYDVATCPSGWSLDTSSGVPATWTCVQTTYKFCNTLV